MDKVAVKNSSKLVNQLLYVNVLQFATMCIHTFACGRKEKSVFKCLRVKWRAQWATRLPTILLEPILNIVNTFNWIARVKRTENREQSTFVNKISFLLTLG